MTYIQRIAMALKHGWKKLNQCGRWTSFIRTRNGRIVSLIRIWADGTIETV